MKITDVPFGVLRLQYQLARFPLQLIEDQVVARLDSEAPARLFYERSLGMLDATVGNALGDSELEQRGAALVERSDALRRAARLDSAAAENIKQADAELKVTREKAAKEKQDAVAETERERTEARKEAQERKRAAVDNAGKRIGAGKKQADEVAARRKKAAEAVKSEEQARIQAAEHSANAAAAAKLEDAQEKRGEAAGKRARADRIEDLADTEKHKRRAERANEP